MPEKHRSFCPIASTLDILGDKWTLLVVRDLMFGRKSRYEEFLASPERISTNILAERLRRLEEHGLVSKQPYGSHPGRMAYSLTAKGESLRPVLRAVIEWGLANIHGTRLPERRK